MYPCTKQFANAMGIIIKDGTFQLLLGAYLQHCWIYDAKNKTEACWKLYTRAWTNVFFLSYNNTFHARKKKSNIWNHIQPTLCGYTRTSSSRCNMRLPWWMWVPHVKYMYTFDMFQKPFLLVSLLAMLMFNLIINVL